MKKISIGLTAIILAVSAFAFTHVESKAKFVDPYWFTTDNMGNVQNASSVPPQQAADPFGCTTGTKGCSKAYSNYTIISPGVYGPSGTLQITHKKP